MRKSTLAVILAAILCTGAGPQSQGPPVQKEEPLTPAKMLLILPDHVIVKHAPPNKYFMKSPANFPTGCDQAFMWLVRYEFVRSGGRFNWSEFFAFYHDALQQHCAYPYVI